MRGILPPQSRLERRREQSARMIDPPLGEVVGSCGDVATQRHARTDRFSVQPVAMSVTVSV